MSEFAEDPTRNLPYAHGGPVLTGRLRAQPEHFQVEEDLGYAASGEGEHAFLTVRKRELNTTDVARALARFAGVKQMAVGFAGLKDRIAVTTQSFSVHLPGQADPDWSALGLEGLEVVCAERHNRKIRRGSLRGNRFVLVLSDLEGERENAEARLAALKVQGVPNYFGAQRFGRQGSNLSRAQDWLAGEGRRPKPEQRRMLVSAARSQLFNQVLAERVRQGSWQHLLPGEVVMLDGSGRQFAAEHIDEVLLGRVQQGDVHPSGPMPGKPSRALMPLDEAAKVESEALAASGVPGWVDALVERGIDADRRALRLMPQELSWRWINAQQLELRFGLPSGSYATALVRELMSD